jgi:hypothetical protein
VASDVTAEAVLTVLVGSAANLLEDQSPVWPLGPGVTSTMEDGGVPLVMVSAPVVVASGVTVAFIWLETIVELVALTVPLASSVGPRTPVNMSHGAGSAVCCCWSSDCSDCRDLVPSPLID